MTERRCSECGFKTASTAGPWRCKECGKVNEKPKEKPPASPTSAQNTDWGGF